MQGQTANKDTPGGAMRIGASTFIWVSPFSNKTLDPIDRVKAFGFDLIEICVEDPETIHVAAIGARARSVGIEVTVCGPLKRLDVFFGNLKNALQKSGLIRYVRGKIEILDRKGLEECACECYAAIRERIDSVVTRERNGAV
jgi:sugar phosphate isomerase/epimerase